ncbi:hypothetical protein KQX54_001854 [Cotesia glomerata]|uniref:Uncharacterized protein n=1 Tax=Cotesia glomerata TaxID=32391 RepID=A0AAV7IMI5_COTGL|nr:hypothetical protein KQX54_001854 [Cotesia glomerata]
MPENNEEKIPENNGKQSNCEKVDFTSNEDISAMQPGQSVELIGFVDEVEASHLAGSHFVFKFLLNNNNGKRVQIAAWRGGKKNGGTYINLQDNLFGGCKDEECTCGYLKTAFSVKKSSMSTRNEAFSYVTDRGLQLEIKVSNYTDSVLKQGDHVEVIGTPKVIDDSLVLKIESVNQIRKIDEETKPLVWLLRGKNSIPLSEYNKRQKLNQLEEEIR